jgi:hypothetical protein
LKHSILSIDARRLAAFTSAFAAALLMAGCGPVRLTANANIPTPLVVKAPIGVALFVPKEFSEYVHKEERWGTDWNVDLGAAHTEALHRLLNAMFERVVTVDSLNAGTQAGLGVSAILEPSIEEYAFVTPRDAGSPFYAVSIKYRVNVYSPDGRLADSWGFTGYGTSPSQGISSTAPLAEATSLALRDAGAKLAVEFTEQAVMRGLLPGGGSIDRPASSSEPAPASGEVPAIAPAHQSEAAGESQPPEQPSEDASKDEDAEKQDDPGSDDGASEETAPSERPGAREETAQLEAFAIS